MREQLSAMGYAVPRRKYSFQPATTQTQVTVHTNQPPMEDSEEARLAQRSRQANVGLQVNSSSSCTLSGSRLDTSVQPPQTGKSFKWPPAAIQRTDDQTDVNDTDAHIRTQDPKDENLMLPPPLPSKSASKEQFCPLRHSLRAGSIRSVFVTPSDSVVPEVRETTASAKHLTRFMEDFPTQQNSSVDNEKAEAWYLREWEEQREVEPNDPVRRSVVNETPVQHEHPPHWYTRKFASSTPSYDELVTTSLHVPKRRKPNLDHLLQGDEVNHTTRLSPFKLSRDPMHNVPSPRALQRPTQRSQLPSGNQMAPCQTDSVSSPFFTRPVASTSCITSEQEPPIMLSHHRRVTSPEESTNWHGMGSKATGVRDHGFRFSKALRGAKIPSLQERYVVPPSPSPRVQYPSQEARMSRSDTVLRATAAPLPGTASVRYSRSQLHYARNLYKDNRQDTETGRKSGASRPSQEYARDVAFSGANHSGCNERTGSSWLHFSTTAPRRVVRRQG